MRNRQFDAVVFDRDDTLTVDVNWTYKHSDFAFMPGAAEAVAMCNALGMLVFIATNQGGIGKQLYTTKDMHDFHWLLKKRLSEHNAWIDDIAYCPHFPYPPHDPLACGCRKPNPGLLSQLCIKWELQPARVLMVGDKQTDIDAATRAGMHGILFDGTNLCALLTDALADKVQ
ncbi:D-glycero-alpha-D-manno-heptose-1,7-bisphosphate 7-phosphatase [Aestuariibacter salexigens]|uniref:D-glycero-alpha-D-manno-heptose-1,7-bisphosphate 7-phosphatase n=1 Tax=Aestuariibacter salexigens TaxID=226010 RepID=UPI0004192378|nr:HAD-IIIA family hydrolase [Aestuariibacter salexigens]